tara:strand:+ start:50 stop:550 length:501 start_codon:yes stop_codon:yes gene_type:complete
MTKHFTLLFHIIFPILLSIGLAWGQNTTSVSSNNKNVSDKLIQSFRSDLGKFYTMTYPGEFLGQRNNKLYFRPVNDAPMKILRLKEIKELKQDNKVLIKNGKWKVEPNSIKPYDGSFIDSEETSTEELLKYKKVKSSHIIIGCGIISVVALGGLYLYFVQTFNLGV